ncbi:MAG: hypothetical protein KDH89_05125, partial [Anaerolineae bacterium]|nr:hypothetical protein [Anaerolineae bacterium]
LYEAGMPVCESLLTYVLPYLLLPYIHGQLAWVIHVFVVAQQFVDGAGRAAIHEWGHEPAANGGDGAISHEVRYSVDAHPIDFSRSKRPSKQRRYSIIRGPIRGWQFAQKG